MNIQNNGKMLAVALATFFLCGVLSAALSAASPILTFSEAVKQKAHPAMLTRAECQESLAQREMMLAASRMGLLALLPGSEENVRAWGEVIAEHDCYLKALEHAESLLARPGNPLLHISIDDMVAINTILTRVVPSSRRSSDLGHIAGLRKHLDRRATVIYRENLADLIIHLDRYYKKASDLRRARALLSKGLGGATPEDLSFLSPVMVVTPDADKVPDLLARMLETFKEKIAHGEDPFNLAAWFHMEFGRTHPFYLGNGRTARIFMNMILMAHGIEPVAVLDEDSYLAAVHASTSKNNNEPLVRFLHERSPSCRAGVRALVVVQTCASCGKEDAKNKCARCKQVWYCSEACQRADWKAGHKVSCKPA